MPKRAYTKRDEIAGVYLWCRACQRSARNWYDYTCPRCAAFNSHVYRREHRDPDYAATLTLYGIAEEYRQAGMAVPLSLARTIGHERRDHAA